MRGKISIHINEISFLNRIADSLSITLLFLLIVDIPEYVLENINFPPSLVIFFSAFFFLSKVKLYRSFRSDKVISIFSTIAMGWLSYNFFLLTLSFILKFSSYFSRVEVTIWVFLSFFTLILNNLLFRVLLRSYRSKGGNTKTILYWGNAKELNQFSNQIQQNSWMGYKIIAWFYHENQIGIDPQVENLIFGGTIPDMKNWLNHNEVDRIIFSDSSESKISKEIINLFGDTSIPVTYQPSWANKTMSFEVNNIGDYLSVNIWSGQNNNNLMRFQKRIFDVSFAAITLVICSPFLLLFYFLIRIESKGPSIFCQYRYGLNGKRFKIYKFRTMKYVEEEKIKDIKQAEANDPRITSLGKFLRKYSIDELPQLINVLKNEMSIVGPRPHAVQHNEIYRKLILGYMQRHSFLPGMTGLAQIKGFRGETRQLSDMQKRIEYDLIYQKQWSLLYDLKIILFTVLKIKSPKAY